MDEITIERQHDPGNPGHLHLKLSGSLTICQAALLKETLVSGIREADELRVDLSGVTEVDLTALQLLGATHRTSLAQGKRFSVLAAGNQAYLDAVADAGFSRHTGCSRDKHGTCIWVGGKN